MSAWTTEQVLSLAPDASSAKAAHKQSSPGVWSGTGASERALWGLCQGSGAKPYQTVVDLAEPAFRCSCPSRKFPCKHALGLMLLWVGSPSALTGSEPPGWAEGWLVSRDERAVKRAAPPAEPRDPEAAAADAAKRAAKREQRVLDGVAELRLWLDDLVRQGFAQAEQRGSGEFARMAARLVDAQAPGLARRVSVMAGIPGYGADWPQRLLRHASLLSLLADVYPRHAELGDGLREDVRTLVGWTTAAEDVIAGGERVRDAWRCVGQFEEFDERLRVRRTWLWGEGSGRYALLLDFAHPSRPLPPAPTVGQLSGLELAFYPSAVPLRAQVAERYDADGDGSLPVAGSVAGALTRRAEALAANPWTERLPVAVSAVPFEQGGAWLLADADHDALALHRSYDALVDLSAFAGGRPVAVFGEVEERGLIPLGAWRDGSVVAF